MTHIVAGALTGRWRAVHHGFPSTSRPAMQRRQFSAALSFTPLLLLAAQVRAQGLGLRVVQCAGCSLLLHRCAQRGVHHGHAFRRRRQLREAGADAAVEQVVPGRCRVLRERRCDLLHLRAVTCQAEPTTP